MQMLGPHEQVDAADPMSTPDQRRGRHGDLGAADRDDRAVAVDLIELGLQQRAFADEGRDETVGRAAIEPLRRIDLADAAARHHRDAVGQRQRLALVMGDEDRGDAEPALDFLDLDLHRGAQILVERGERLVEQQHLGLDHQRARQRHALLLAAGQLPRLAVLEAGKLHHRQHVGDALPDLVLADAARLQAIGDVVGDIHMREQRVILEHDAGLARDRPARR